MLIGKLVATNGVSILRIELLFTSIVFVLIVTLYLESLSSFDALSFLCYDSTKATPKTAFITKLTSLRLYLSFPRTCTNGNPSFYPL